MHIFVKLLQEKILQLENLSLKEDAMFENISPPPDCQFNTDIQAKSDIDYVTIFNVVGCVYVIVVTCIV